MGFVKRTGLKSRMRANEVQQQTRQTSEYDANQAQGDSQTGALSRVWSAVVQKFTPKKKTKRFEQNALAPRIKVTLGERVFYQVTVCVLFEKLSWSAGRDVHLERNEVNARRQVPVTRPGVQL